MERYRASRIFNLETVEAPRVSKVDIGGANKLLWPRGLIIDVTLDASQTFSKSGDLRGHFKVV